MGRQLRILAGMILGVGLGGCFTDSINSKPKVLEINRSDPIVRGMPVTFTAKASDDQGPLTYTWYAAHVCDAPPADILSGGVETPSGGDPDSSFEFTPPEPGHYCVWVVVEDPQHAKSLEKTSEFDLKNLPPYAQIDEVPGPQGPVTEVSGIQVPLYSALHFTAGGSMDTDSNVPLMTPIWTLEGPDGVPMPPPCEDPVTDTCFTVNEPGHYTLTVTVTDGDGEPTTSAPKEFVVAEDREPCIVGTEPTTLGTIFRGPDEDITFSVRGVDDDGDPLPPSGGGAKFVWSWRVVPADFHRVADYDMPSLPKPDGPFRTGDQLEVRAEVHDRVVRPGELVDCYKAQPQPSVCETGNKCARWVTWTVQIQ